MKLLYVEDNVELARTVKQVLGKWYVVDLAFTSTKGLQRADTHDYDIIMIDYYLPDYNGLELCKQIRTSNSESLLLFLTTNETKKSIIEALSAGADDYLTKPFNMDELIARLQAIVRRRYAFGQELLVCGDFRVDQKNQEIYYKGIKLPLKRKEFLIFEYLVMHRGHIVSRSTLFEHVWNSQYFISNTVDVHIKRLRSKVEVPYNIKVIETIYGKGYRMIKP